MLKVARGRGLGVEQGVGLGRHRVGDGRQNGVGHVQLLRQRVDHLLGRGAGCRAPRAGRVLGVALGRARTSTAFAAFALCLMPVGWG